MRTASQLLLLSLIFAALSTPAVAETAPSPLNLGFSPSDSAGVPEAVRAQRKFIYQLDIPYFASVREKDYEDLLGIDTFPEVSKRDLRTCQDAKLPSCMIHFSAIRGTAFLAENGRDVWTNCHLVHEWIAYRKQELMLAHVPTQELVKRILLSPIPLTLADSEHHTVYAAGNTEAEKAHLQAVVLRNLRTPEDLECSLGDDAVKIQLPHALAAAGIPEAKAPLAPLETAYVGGYPKPTTSRQDFGASDSDGHSFYWTRGPFLQKKDFAGYFGPGDKYSFAFAGPYTLAILSDGAESMSGGPVLNARGERIGIYKGFLPLNEKDHDVPLASVAISNDGLRYIEIFSEDLPHSL